MRIELNNVTKTFGSVTALDHVNVAFEGPHIYGLLGRNGAGKSTLLNLVCGRLFPTAGEILLDGEPVQENDRALGQIYCMTEKNNYPNHLKVGEVFRWSREFYPAFNLNYAQELSEKFELNLKARNDKLSTGYTSIFRLIIALACGAPVILLDEPVLGLDASHRELFYRELVENYADQPRLVLLSTHLIGEAAGLIDRAVILKSGRVILDDETEHLTAGAYSVSGPAGAVDAFAAGKTVLGSDTLGGLKTVYLRGDPREAGTLPAGMELGKMDLQKLFIELTNR